jgi:ribose 5-phosphate isomerase B
MRIVIGSDHRGYEPKRRLVSTLQQLGHTVSDLGTTSADSCDYPDYGYAVAKQVGTGAAERGILICGTGLGMCITANKVRGVRAATCQDLITAEMSRRHNNANVLCLSSDLLGEELMVQMVRTWLETPFEAGRHARRVDKISQIEEQEYGRQGDRETRRQGDG